MKIKNLLCATLLVSFSYANEHTLNDLIKIALDNNTNISISKLSVDNKKASIGVAKADYLPNLSATAEAAQYDLDNATTNNNGQVESITITASQLIYDFGKTYSAIAASKEDYEAALKEVTATTSNTILDVKTAYYNILNQYRLIEVAQESVKIDQLQLEQASEFLKAGVKTKIDVTNAKLQLSNSQLDLLKAQYALKNAKTQLITLLGKEHTQQELQIKSENRNIESLTKNILQKDTFILDNLISEALNNRAEIMVQQSLVNYQRKLYSSSKGDFFPSIKLQGSYKDSNADQEISSLDATQYSAGLYLQWDFFSGFRTTSNTQKSLAQLLTAKQNLKFQKLNVTEEVTSSYYKVNESIDSLKIAVLNVELANQNLELAQQRYINGLNDIVELNDAKLDFVEAKNSLVNTYYDYQTALANLDYARGIIYKQ